MGVSRGGMGVEWGIRVMEGRRRGEEGMKGTKGEEGGYIPILRIEGNSNHFEVGMYIFSSCFWCYGVIEVSNRMFKLFVYTPNSNRLFSIRSIVL